MESPQKDTITQYTPNPVLIIRALHTILYETQTTRLKPFQSYSIDSGPGRELRPPWELPAPERLAHCLLWVFKGLAGFLAGFMWFCSALKKIHTEAFSIMIGFRGMFSCNLIRARTFCMLTWMIRKVSGCRLRSPLTPHT